MKTLKLIILSLLFSNLFSQEIVEKNIKTDVSEVTVFIDGAQIHRKKSIDLAQGKTILKFTDLSPFIDPKSVQIKTKGEVTVLSVNHQHKYPDNLDETKELNNLENLLKSINEKKDVQNTYLSIFREELLFLRENRDIGGKSEQTNFENLKQTSEFYGTKLSALMLKEIDIKRKLKDLDKEELKINKKINEITSKKVFPTGEVLVKVDSKIGGSYSFEISYVVSNAGWFPSYDVRAKNISEPVELTYKANVKQNTLVDWKNVKLKFSSSDPNFSGVAPELQTYLLNYYSKPPVYKKLASNNVSGTITDMITGEPLIGASVMIEGTTIGSIADFDGKYNITIPNNTSQLSFSYVGYEDKTIPITSASMNVSLKEDIQELEKVVIVGYSSKSRNLITSSDLQSVPGVSLNQMPSKYREPKNIPIPVIQIENQTTVDFEIETPYTIKSSNKSYSVEMAHYELPATYQYYSVPKINKNAYLKAYVVDWAKYHLLEGEANIFFEDTYIGKTILDVQYVTDTLEISLGRDKKVSVSRDKLKDFTTRQLIGGKKEEIKAWRTTVVNNKNQSINMLILDQIPVSTVESIEVVLQNSSSAKHNKETGEIKWEFRLKPGNKKVFDLKYSVEYPKYRSLNIE